jgi:menaquinone-specific isochorismate synthase
VTASSATRAVGRRALTHPADELPTALISAIPEPTGALAFLSGGDGMVAWGEYARLEAHGQKAAAEISGWLAETVADLDVDDRVSVPGSGPIAFVSLGFDAHDTAVAIVPSVVLGRRGGVEFSTVIGEAPLHSPTPITPPGAVSYSDAGLSVAGFTSAVARAVRRIRAGELRKVVLAHDLQAWTQNPVDERHLLNALAADYPTCWTFAVDGLVGASPETLIRRTGRRISSRVLAGTKWAEHGDDQVSADLLASTKDLAEHDLAVASVAESLGPLCDRLEVPSRPHPLVLANLTHLATDVSGHLGSDVSALELAARLHPTAAVGGTPRDVALRLIRDLEPGPRRRYAAPVGWVDAHGDGEFAIALRCAEISGHSVRLLAGCGIMADSVPEVEAREAQIKMIPVRDALEAS